MENKKLNETYERPLAELVDLFPEGSICEGSAKGPDMNTDDTPQEW